MSSWFTDLSAQVGDLTNKVQAAIPIDKETIQKLTLTTPEMTAERQRIYEEEQRKEQVKDSLAGMLPWETRDTEREILVEECKEAILLLSSREDTFLGPFEMPALPKTNDDDEEEDEEQSVAEAGPSEESLEKLAKLEPLPPLLADFDLDAHVGLIQRLLEVDENLVEQQSKLSGAGDRERTFWRNYFFHCAFTRYEAGLSIDEVWNDQPPSSTTTTPYTSIHGEGGGEGHGAPEETITFEDQVESGSGGDASSAAAAAAAAASASTPLFDSKPAATAAANATLAAAEDTVPPSITSSVGSNEGIEYEMISGADGGDTAELDELEAEIARELED